MPLLRAARAQQGRHVPLRRHFARLCGGRTRLKTPRTAAMPYRRSSSWRCSSPARGTGRCSSTNPTNGEARRYRAPRIPDSTRGTDRAAPAAPGVTGGTRCTSRTRVAGARTSRKSRRPSSSPWNAQASQRDAERAASPTVPAATPTPTPVDRRARDAALVSRGHDRPRHAVDRPRGNVDRARQRVLRAVRHADHERARRAAGQQRDAAEHGRLERDRAGAPARAGASTSPCSR